MIPQRPDHAEGLFHALTDPRIYRFLDDGPPASVAAVRARIERLMAGGPPDRSEIWLNWCVFQGEAIVGFTQATIAPDRRASIAYVLSPEVWGKGVAEQAARLTMAALVDQHGISQFIADTETGNLASQGLLARLGFVEDRRDGDDIHYTRTDPAAVCVADPR